MKNINKIRGYGKDNPNWRGGKFQKCLNCGSEFWVKPSHVKKRQCCSIKCASEYCRKTKRLAGSNNPAYGAKKLQLICNNCGKYYEKLVRLCSDKYVNNYCSIKCAGCAIGKRPKFGDNNPNYGNGIKITGEHNPNWKGGISFEPYCHHLWNDSYKQEIKERDNFKCRNPFCNGRSHKLYIHHIDYVKKNCHPLNLITLCNSCHSKSNFKRDWHYSFYSEIIKTE